MDQRCFGETKSAYLLSQPFLSLTQEGFSIGRCKEASTTTVQLTRGGGARSLRINEHVVVVRGHSPVLAVVVFLWEIFLVVSEESVKLNALLEVLDSLHASDLLQEIEVAINIDAGANQSVPVDTLKSDVGVVLLELEVNGLEEVNVGTLDCVHILARHLKLVEVEVFGEHLHLCYIYY